MCYRSLGVVHSLFLLFRHLAIILFKNEKPFYSGVMFSENSTEKKKNNKSEMYSCRFRDVDYWKRFLCLLIAISIGNSMISSDIWHKYHE